MLSTHGEPKIFSQGIFCVPTQRGKVLLFYLVQPCKKDRLD